MEEDEQEEEWLFGVSDDDNGNDENDDSDCGEDYYDEDAGTCESFQNVVALQVLIDREITSSDKIVDYYSIRHVFNTILEKECLLIAIFVHHVFLTQSNNFK